MKTKVAFSSTFPTYRQVPSDPARQGRVAVQRAGEGEHRGVPHEDLQGQPHRDHVRPVLALRQVHHPPLARKRGRPRPDEQLLHGAG